MKKITFKQFILTYNFRAFSGIDANPDDTTILRINYPMSNKSYYTDEWFEFGISDFSDKKNKLEQIKTIFSDYMLNMYVDCIKFDKNINNVVNIYLSKEKYIE